MNSKLAAAFIAAAAFGVTVGSQIEPFGRAEAQSRPAVVAAAQAPAIVATATPAASPVAVDPDRAAREVAPARRAVRVIPIYNLPAAPASSAVVVPAAAGAPRAS